MSKKAEKRKEVESSALHPLGDGTASGVNPELVWKLYQKALAFNAAINLEETVQVNENFFVGEFCRR